MGIGCRGTPMGVRVSGMMASRIGDKCVGNSLVLLARLSIKFQDALVSFQENILEYQLQSTAIDPCVCARALNVEESDERSKDGCTNGGDSMPKEREESRNKLMERLRRIVLGIPLHGAEYLGESAEFCQQIHDEPSTSAKVILEV
jgi:hypothetical protein